MEETYAARFMQSSVYKNDNDVVCNSSRCDFYSSPTTARFTYSNSDNQSGLTTIVSQDKKKNTREQSYSEHMMRGGQEQHSKTKLETQEDA
tara:strand:+ start:243 stop:515 length:273 start_codon:yes stop_codon:yes gene_type:complete